ncbi:energy transducer TonB [Mucilaginibacter sp. McL0603]|uniref:energy transducer TonB n=1 Tax=Mucilaginibacter sp. McL0603 TaxID=3415670 RepID=UPI003CEDD01A
MKKTLLITFLSLSFLVVNAQNHSRQKIDTIDITQIVDSSTLVYTAIESPAEYPGGPVEFLNYIIKNLKIPPVEFVRGVVLVRFAIGVDGHLIEPTIIKGIVTEGMKNKILLVFNESPVWKPAIQNRKPVRIKYTIPLNLD